MSVLCFFLSRFNQIYGITKLHPMIFPVGEAFKYFCLFVFFVSLDRAINIARADGRRNTPCLSRPSGRTHSSSRASLVPAARFPPVAARWSPSMRRERQIHIRVFPLTFHWLPQPLGVRAELLLEPVRTVGSSQTQKDAGFGVIFVLNFYYIS